MTLTLFFYEISEYVNFFCLKMFLSQKKLLVNTNFVKKMLQWMKSMKNYGEIYFSSNNLVQNGFAAVSTI